MDNYSYPIDPEWSREELVLVINFLALVEEANNASVERATFMENYRLFKTVVKSIGEEKALGREFEKASGYSIYQTVQAAKQTDKKRFKVMK